MSDIILFAHPTFGVLGIMAAVWILVEALNASEANQGRIRLAANAVTPANVSSALTAMGQRHWSSGSAGALATPPRRVRWRGNAWVACERVVSLPARTTIDRAPDGVNGQNPLFVIFSR